jgi:hypothetical protein
VPCDRDALKWQGDGDNARWSRNLAAAHAEDCACELFTQAQVMEFIGWNHRAEVSAITVRPVNLPTSFPNELPLEQSVCGGGVDMLLMDRNESGLSFDLGGVYDLRFVHPETGEFAPGEPFASVTPDHFDPGKEVGNGFPF